MNRTRVRATAVLLFLLALSGCSTVKTSDSPPGELQDQIATGQIIKPGDLVSVTTLQGITHDLEIVQVTEESVKGLEDVPEDQLHIDENADVSMQTMRKNLIDIPVEEIRSIQTREISPVAKAAGATGAAVAVGGIMYFIYFMLPALLVGGLAGL
jgi:hypothetical protein